MYTRDRSATSNKYTTNRWYWSGKVTHSYIRQWLDPEIVFITATAWVSCGFPGSLLHSSSSPSVGSVHMDLYSWYPLIIDSIENNSHPTSLNRHVRTRARILKLGADVYLNYFNMRLIKLSSSIRQSLFRQWCFPCHFANVWTLQSFPPYGNRLYRSFHSSNYSNKIVLYDYGSLFVWIWYFMNAILIVRTLQHNMTLYNTNFWREKIWRITRNSPNLSFLKPEVFTIIS